jgi:hypothetical protein
MRSSPSRNSVPGATRASAAASSGSIAAMNAP